MGKSLVSCLLTRRLDVAILNVSAANDTGISIDYPLDYSNHINAIVTKANQKACLTLRCFKSEYHSLLFRAFTTYASL